MLGGAEAEVLAVVAGHLTTSFSTLRRAVDLRYPNELQTRQGRNESHKICRCSAWLNSTQRERRKQAQRDREPQKTEIR